MRRRSWLFAFAACAVLPSAVLAQNASAPLPVVASMSILADFARQVGGDRVEVVSLVGPNGDAHAFEPSPGDARRLAAAKLIVVNGLGLESWMDRLVKASRAQAPVVVATKGLRPIAGNDEAHGSHSGHRHRDDPHGWQSVANAKLYIENIRAGLVGVDPAGASVFDANAAAYSTKLDELERDIKAALGAIPPARREIVTTHDAFGYFGRAYGLKFIAPQGVSTESEVNAADVARIIRQVRSKKIKAVFLENVSDPRLAARIAAESGAKVGDKLFSDALSEPGGPAPTYLDMMRHNLRAFTAALSD